MAHGKSRLRCVPPQRVKQRLTLLNLHTDDGPTGIAGLTHTARPVLLDLADRADLREAARGREGRIDIVTADVVDRPADALLIRPDAYIAWAATTGQPGDEDAVALQEALAHWFGEPLQPL